MASDRTNLSQLRQAARRILQNRAPQVLGGGHVGLRHHLVAFTLLQQLFTAQQPTHPAAIRTIQYIGAELGRFYSLEGFINKGQAQGIQQRQSLLKPGFAFLLLISQGSPAALGQLFRRERNGSSLITRMRTQIRGNLPVGHRVTILAQEIRSAETAGLGAG